MARERELSAPPGGNPPVGPPRAVARQAGPPVLDGEYREIHPPVAVSPVPQPQPAGPGERSLLGRVWDSLKDPRQWAVVGAEARRGLKDLQDVVLDPFPDHHVARHEEPGTIANPTQREVYQRQHEAAPDWDGATARVRGEKIGPNLFDQERAKAREAAQREPQKEQELGR